MRCRLDAVATYLQHASPRGALDKLLAPERIVFCCQSRLLAAVWVRAERGRFRAEDDRTMPSNLLGACTTLQEALQICLEHQPTLLISTQLLEEGSGLDLVVRAKQQHPGLRTVLFLQHNHRTLLEEAIKTHSDGLVLESEIGSGHVMAALRTVSRGGMYLDPTIARQLHGSRDCLDPGLSKRELAVMQQVAWGMIDREIADQLNLATDTVKYHLKQVYQKLNVHNRTRAAISLVLMGLVEPPHPLLPDSAQPTGAC